MEGEADGDGVRVGVGLGASGDGDEVGEGQTSSCALVEDVDERIGDDPSNPKPADPVIDADPGTAVLRILVDAVGGGDGRFRCSRKGPDSRVVEG